MNIPKFPRVDYQKEYKEQQEKFYAGRAIGYKISWQNKTTFRKLEEGEDESTVYFGENEITGDSFNTALIFNDGRIN